MKHRNSITPYMFSSDMGVNASLSLGKIRKRIRDIDPTYKPSSLYKIRLKSKRAGRLTRPGIVRP